MRPLILIVFSIIISFFQISSSFIKDRTDTDYCEIFGKDDIQGKKHGFLAGNLVYYIGGQMISQKYDNDRSHETIGLTHPFHHDLRSRGTGISFYEGVGTGNDFYGWAFYKYTKVALGTVVTDENRWETPVPTHMYWRPDKMIVEYELTNPYVNGIFDGYCQNWQEGSSNNFDSHWENLTENECWDHCNADPLCFQAVFEVKSEQTQCWIGLNKMTEQPDSQHCGICKNRCYAKETHINPVMIREEKFISSSDVISTTITADRPVFLEIQGQSFGEGSSHIISLNPKCSFDQVHNAILVKERGKVFAKVSNKPIVEQEAKLMYDGMSMILSASRSLENVTFSEMESGACVYNFIIPLDSQGTTLSWAMNDEEANALTSVKDVLDNTKEYQEAKTTKMNSLLNNVVPHFRCSDDDIVKIYYYLWALHLMYYTDGNQGMQTMPHTQTAVNNFLGMHRYDAVMQILVGSWTSPDQHDFYANGNALVWSNLLPYRSRNTLPDNFGIDWVSGVYGTSTIAHIQGAWQIYEHSGNKTFLSMAYSFYKELFWEEINGYYNYGYDSVLCLNKMAEILGFEDDASHWNETVNMDNLDHTLQAEWERDLPNLFGSVSQDSVVGQSQIAPAGISMFPREWLDIMAREWLDDSINGMFGKVPLSDAYSSFPYQNHMKNFASTPGMNWLVIRPLYIHSIDGLANKITLAHLKKYHMEWNHIPVAPEARHFDGTLHGDQYSNINAGKILLIIEGIGGMKYSIHEDTFTFADNLPKEWDFMEFHVPVLVSDSGNVTWVKCRSERQQLGEKILKTVTVESNPFRKLIISPWLDDLELITSSVIGTNPNPPAGHTTWEFEDSNANIVVQLRQNNETSN